MEYMKRTKFYIWSYKMFKGHHYNSTFLTKKNKIKTLFTKMTLQLF